MRLVPAMLLTGVVAAICAPGWAQDSRPGTRCTRMHTRGPHGLVRVLPNRPPTVSLRTATVRGSEGGLVVQLKTTAKDPDGDHPLLYTYSTTGGRIVGDGPVVLWTLPSQPGTYMVSVEVDDQLGCTSVESAEQTVP